MQAISRLSHILLSPSDRTAKMVDKCLLIEAKLTKMAAALHQAADANPSPSGILAALAHEVAGASGAAGRPSGAPVDLTDRAGSTQLASSLSDAQFEAAVMAPVYRQLKTDVAALDLCTMKGRLDALELSFAAGLAIVVRVLFTGSATLARRDSLLAALLSLRPYLPAYFFRTWDPPPQNLITFSNSA